MKVSESKIPVSFIFGPEFESVKRFEAKSSKSRFKIKPVELRFFNSPEGKIL
jgi:hypothetical protein